MPSSREINPLPWQQAGHNPKPGCSVAIMSERPEYFHAQSTIWLGPSNNTENELLPQVQNSYRQWFV
jgi:hypothetical protein